MKIGETKNINMELSEKYLQKITTITDFEELVSISEDECKRYGKYRELEGAIEVGLSDVRLACREVLNKMATEDELK
jgi:hypothetical protein